LGPRAEIADRFQTNARAVEAEVTAMSDSIHVGFRRTLVRLKPIEEIRTVERETGFRRTLVRLKRL